MLKEMRTGQLSTEGQTIKGATMTGPGRSMVSGTEQTARAQRQQGCAGARNAPAEGLHLPFDD